MYSAQQGDRLVSVECGDLRRGKIYAEIHIAPSYRLDSRNACSDVDVAHIGESFRKQQILGSILRGNEDRRELG
jgi:hypothetical protein